MRLNLTFTFTGEYIQLPLQLEEILQDALQLADLTSDDQVLRPENHYHHHNDFKFFISHNRAIPFRQRLTNQYHPIIYRRIKNNANLMHHYLILIYQLIYQILILMMQVN